MDFRHNVQSEFFCNAQGFSMLKLEHLVNNDYHNTEIILEVLLKMRAAFKMVTQRNIPLYQNLPSSSRIYVKAKEHQCLGYLVVADDSNGPGRLRVLEFYVYEPFQRFGHGKSLFDKMLQVEMKSAQQCSGENNTLPYNRFIRKHYHLDDSMDPSQFPSSGASTAANQDRRDREVLSNVGRQMVGSSSVSGLQSPATVGQKQMQFSGKRPRPEFITPIFDKHYNLFQGAFHNNSTSPAKYDPSQKDYNFDLDFSKVGGKQPKL